MALICQCGCGQEIPPSPVHGKRFRYMPKFIRGHANRTPEYAAKFAEARAARLAAQPVLICQCGCGEVIPPKTSHRKRAPMYIQAHYLKMGAHPRIQRMKEEQAKRRVAPPPDWPIPTGICECGCGEPTKVARLSKPDRGQYSGYPLRFVNGHNGRLLRAERNHQWKGGKIAERRGYIYVHAPGEPGVTSRDGYILEHRLVYQQSRGVVLHPKVEVHHINGVRTDNRPENLEAVTKGEHKRAHVLAQSIASLAFDDRLWEAVRAHVRSAGTLPDLRELTQQVYGAHAARP